MSERRSDTRRLLSLDQPWENGPRTPSPDTKGVPDWVTAGYNDDPRGLAIAVAHYREPKTTPDERAAVRAFNHAPRPAGYACSRCGKHAFDKPTVCFWCRR